MTLKKYIFILFAVLTGFVVNAQTEVHAVLDSNSIGIGAQTKLDIYLTYDASAQKNLDVIWPEFEDTIKKGIEIVNITQIDIGSFVGWFYIDQFPDDP